MKLVPRNYSFIDDLFDDVFDRPVFKGSNALMKTDVHEKDGNYILDVELPGYDKQDIDIDLREGYLTISAKHNYTDEEKDAKGNVLRQERSFGSCSRSFYVGSEIKPEDVSASFENGVLVLTIPKEVERRIEENRKVTIR